MLDNQGHLYFTPLERAELLRFFKVQIENEPYKEGSVTEWMTFSELTTQRYAEEYFTVPPLDEDDELVQGMYDLAHAEAVKRGLYSEAERLS